MPNLLPILALAAAAVVLSKKKKKKKADDSGVEPGDAPGSGAGASPAGGMRPMSGALAARQATARSLVWNDALARTARNVMAAKWRASGKTLSGLKISRLMLQTAQAMWPQIQWPQSISHEAKMIEIAPGNRIPQWVYVLGDDGANAQQIWINLRTLAWDTTGYKPPV